VARLHGDLWTGNILWAEDGRPWLIDPSAYGGRREVDLAMLSLFGGLGGRFNAAYEEVWPLADGHEDRVPLYQLYPLLVHAVLFGGGYGTRAVVAAGQYR
jgi:fructosamine-3-kinase